MSANNNITIVGNLGRDPEMSYKGADGSMAVTKASVAVNRSRGEGTDWFNVVAFRGTAEYFNNYGRKGRKVAIQGEMRQNRWTDEEGNTRTSWELVANNIQFLDRPVDDDSDDLGEPD